MAVSNVNGPITLYIPKDSNVSASENPEFRPDTSKLIVNAVTLDDYCSKNGLGFPDLIKLDTETTEPKIIEGMKKIINARKPDIICEVLDKANTHELTALLKPEGYRFYFIVKNRLIRMDEVKRDNSIQWQGKQKTPFYNFLFSCNDF
jgi:hypothetical protein